MNQPAGGQIELTQASRFLDLGFVVGLGGATTYERAKRLHRAVKALPDDGYVLETDSPDMPLAGFQGERNEPARVKLVCERIADLREQSATQVADHSTANARRLFGLALG